MFQIFVSLLLFFLPITGYCDVGGIHFDTINDFSKGLNSHSSPYLTPENAAVIAQNVDVNKYAGYVAHYCCCCYKLD